MSYDSLVSLGFTRLYFLGYPQLPVKFLLYTTVWLPTHRFFISFIARKLLGIKCAAFKSV